jgi:hypothetical protein
MPQMPENRSQWWWQQLSQLLQLLQLLQAGAQAGASQAGAQQLLWQQLSHFGAQQLLQAGAQVGAHVVQAGAASHAGAQQDDSSQHP